MALRTVAVVGGGPAGATAARMLAERGARVICYEARRFPREKPCGGGLTPKSLRLIPEAARRSAVAQVSRTEISPGGRGTFVADSSRSAITMVDRSEFDQVMLECAARAGAEIRENVRVRTVVEHERGVVVATGHHRDTFDALIVADGANSGCARALGLAAVGQQRSLALDVEVPAAPDRPADLARLSFSVPGGYAWYFPKGDHASLGVGAKYRPDAPPWFVDRLKEHLSAFADELSIPLDERRVRGHWIPTGLRRERVSTPRVAFVGDAAGTADPLLCEGISFAIVSAIVAVGTIAEVDAGRVADLRVYDSRLRDLLGPAFRRLNFAAQVAHRAPSLSLFAYRVSGWVQRYADDVIAGSGGPFGFELDDAPRIVRPSRAA